MKSPFIQFKNIATGRPVWIDPLNVTSIFDAEQRVPSKLAGAEPTINVIGCCVVCDGVTIPLNEDPAVVENVIAEYRGRYAAPMILAN